MSIGVASTRLIQVDLGIKGDHHRLIAIIHVRLEHIVRLRRLHDISQGIGRGNHLLMRVLRLRLILTNTLGLRLRTLIHTLTHHHLLLRLRGVGMIPARMLVRRGSLMNVLDTLFRLRECVRGMVRIMHPLPLLLGPPVAVGLLVHKLIRAGAGRIEKRCSSSMYHHRRYNK